MSRIFLPALLVMAAPALRAQKGMSELEKNLLLGDGSSSSSESSNSSSDGADPVADNPVNAKEATPSAPKAPEVDKEDLDKLEAAIKGPDHIPLDQIFVVQKRYIQKEDRQEITPLFIGIQPADSFRRQFEWGFSWAYHLNETFGIEAVHVAFMHNYTTGLDDTIRKKTNLLTDFGITPVVVVGSTLIVSPFESKAATRENVYHFETYFNLGGGMALGETSSDAVGIFGVGARSYLNRRTIMKIELRDYLQFSGAVKNRLSFIVGGGFLL